MGFIKAIDGAMEQFHDTYRDVISYDVVEPGVLVKRVTTENGMIQNESRLYVQPGQCAIYTDQGAIKDVIVEPGMYFMDTSAPTLFQTNLLEGLGGVVLESLKRIAYEGQILQKQAVYFIDLKEQLGYKFGTPTPIIFNDVEWGPIEIKLFGSYSFKVSNPIDLITNVVGVADTYRTVAIEEQLKNNILNTVAMTIGKLGVTFSEIQSKNDVVKADVEKALVELTQQFGIQITQVVIASVEPTEEVKNAMRERTAIKMKATSIDNAQADIYTKINTAEAIKDMANNPQNAGATIMGMNMGNTMAGVLNGNINNANNNNNNNQ